MKSQAKPKPTPAPAQSSPRVAISRVLVCSCGRHFMVHRYTAATARTPAERCPSCGSEATREARA